jgi:hypothetical protein
VIQQSGGLRDLYKWRLDLAFEFWMLTGKFEGL